MTRRWPVVAALLAVDGLIGCRADFSGYLSAGRCDPEGRCADGYRCVAGDCVPDGGGGGGSAGYLAAVTGGLAALGARGGGGGVEAGGEAAAGATGLGGATATGGDPARGGAGDGDLTGGATATGGTPSGGMSSTAGQGGAGGEPCAAGLVRCDDDCVDLDSADAHCGSCGNPCDQDPVHLTCGAVVPGQCGCAAAAQCGEGGECDVSNGVCTCQETPCAVGETCLPPIGGSEATCSCGGGVACVAPFTCCLAGGCRDLGVDPKHCGACGRACPGNAWCGAGACMCRSNTCRMGGGDGTCNTTTGRCTCGGSVCAEGQWCLPGDVCG